MEQLTLPLYPAADLLTAERLRFATSIRAPRTLIGYRSDWKTFSAFCAVHDRSPLPASTDTVGLYLTNLLNLGKKISTAWRHVISIRYAHKQAGYPSPCTQEITDLLTGAQRIRQERPNQKATLTVQQLSEICGQLAGDGPAVTRDRAILLFGFATALRRSNLVALDLEDLELSERGILVKIRREKTDQKGVGREIAVVFGQGETCPVRAVHAWLDCRGKEPTGPLFCHTLPGRVGKRLHPEYVNRLVQRATAGIGLEGKRFGSHTLRASFVTEAVGRDANMLKIAATTGHRSLNSLKRYFRSEDPFRNAIALLGS